MNTPEQTFKNYIVAVTAATASFCTLFLIGVAVVDRYDLPHSIVMVGFWGQVSFLASVYWVATFVLAGPPFVVIRKLDKTFGFCGSWVYSIAGGVTALVLGIVATQYAPERPPSRDSFPLNFTTQDLLYVAPATLSGVLGGLVYWWRARKQQKSFPSNFESRPHYREHPVRRKRT